VTYSLIFNSVFCATSNQAISSSGFDGDDRGLGYAVSEAGNHSFVFATDFPHESFDAQSCRIEIEHLLGREDLSKDDKEAMLAKNAKSFYGISR